MRDAGGNILGVPKVSDGGAQGFGYVTGLDINTTDGFMCHRDDTQTAGLRALAATIWTQAFRFGDNVPISYWTFKNPQPYVYDIRSAPSNSSIIWAVAFGWVLKSTDQGANWAKSTTFKGGAIDFTQGWIGDQNSRIGGRHIWIDPVDPNIVLVGHPVDGLYYTVDGGANWTLHASVLAPINIGVQRRGINIKGDVSSISGGKVTVILVQVPGRGIYRFTAGVNGTAPTLMSGSPLWSTDLEAAGGKIFAVGGTDNGASGTPQGSNQLYMHNGTAWSQPSIIWGSSVAARPGVPNTVLIMNQGGGMFITMDGGGTWASWDNIPCTYAATDVPALGLSNNASASLGQIAWHPTLNRIYMVCGTGVFYFDNPPRTAQSQKFQSITGGIENLLIMSMKVTPSSRLLISAQDRPGFIFERGQWKTPAATHAPDYTQALRNGQDMDFAADDENYLVMVYGRGQVTADTISISNDGGLSWGPPAGTVPTFGGAKIAAGNMAIGNKLNCVWCPTSDAPMYYTLDGWATFLTPVFGGGVNMTGAIWTHNNTVRRQILWADKVTPGRFLAYCSGIDGSGSAADLACRGLWESLDGGATWTKYRNGFWENYGNDFYQGKLRPLPGTTGIFWARGNNNGYPTAPSADGLFFLPSKGASLVTMPGFNEVEDICFGKPKTGNTFPRMLARGWRTPVATLTLAVWECNDFNSASPTSATWAQHIVNPGGRIDADMLMVGDMNRYGQFAFAISSGGFYADEYDYRLRAS